MLTLFHSFVPFGNRPTRREVRGLGRTPLPSLAATLLLALFSQAAVAGDVAELVLRKRANVSGPLLLVGDLADVHSSDAELLARLTSTPLGPTPRGNRFLRQGELRDLLRARGVDLTSVRVSGAAAVEIGQPRPEAAAATPVALTRADRIERDSTIEKAISDYLLEQTGADNWQVELITQGATLDSLFGVGELRVAGGKAPWTGRQLFSLTAGRDDTPIAVAVRIQRVSTVVYAITPIETGSLIRASQLELRPHVGSVPSTALTSIESAAGQQARRAIRAEAMVSSSSLRAPVLVRRGETVSVYARTGGVTVRTFAAAKQDGALGDLIQVESTSSRERYAARVSGRRELEVYATGAGVDDYALPSARAASR